MTSYKEKHGTWEERWRAFAAACRGGWDHFPEWLESGVKLTRPVPPFRFRAYVREVVSSVRELVRFVRRAEEPRIPALLSGGCETIVFYHSVSDNVKQPVKELAARLRGRHRRCLVWSYESILLSEPAPSSRGGGGRLIALTGELEGLSTQAFTKAEGVRLLARSFLATIALAAIIVRRGDRILASVLRNPFGIWLALLQSAQRLRAAAFLLDALGVKRVLVTHERHSPGADFLLAARGHAREIRTMLYLHAPPVTFEYPVLSKEIFVWNESAKAGLEALLDPKVPRPSISAVGNWEIDLVLAHPFRALSGKKIGRARAGAPGSEAPAFLFLSQCVGRDDWQSRESTREALDWLAASARLFPSWRFLIKERVYDDTVESLLEESGLIDLPNVELVPRADSYVRLLASPQIRIVAAYSSSGLFVAAGAGKKALRLLVKHAERALPVVDEVTRSVRSAAELQQYLACLPDGKGALDENGESPFFPERGRTLDHIESRCICP